MTGRQASARPVIDGHSWSTAGRLTLRGSYPAAAGPLTAALARQGSTDQHAVALDRSGDRFEAGLDVTAMPVFGRDLPLRDGSWELRFARPDGPDAEGDLPGCEPAWLAGLPEAARSFGRKTYRLIRAGDGGPAIAVAPKLRITEHGKNRRRALNRVYYPLQRALPRRDAIMFVSWKGKQCADNPLAIAAELRRRGDRREQIWAVTDYALPAPEGARTVLTGTQDYFDALARCRYLISNDDMPAHYRKPPGQFYVQTWHGTTLKRIGFDVEQPQAISGAAYLRHLAVDVARWDLLLSPNPFSTPHLRRAFRYDGEVLESGYPRNDVLSSPDAASIAAGVRRRVGVPDGKRVVLYAPTWRDDDRDRSGRYRFDLRLDLRQAEQQLGDDYVFWIRGHHHLAHDVPSGARPGFAVNVTGYPDISELLLACDILVTDYSSIMFDFAPAGRPMLFFTYDLEHYRDRLRGFNLDFEAEAPGPLLTSSAEVVAAIGGIDAVARQYRPAAERFTARYCPLDDGKAGARACDRIFG